MQHRAVHDAVEGVAGILNLRQNMMRARSDTGGRVVSPGEVHAIDQAPDFTGQLVLNASRILPGGVD